MIELAEGHQTSSGAPAPAPGAGSNAPEDDSPCRSEIHIDQTPGSWTLVALLSVAVAGVLIGRWLILHAPEAARFTQNNKAVLQLWAALFAGLCGYGLAVGVVMTRWLLQLLNIFRPRIPWRSAVGWALATILVLLAVTWVDAEIPFGMVAGRPVNPFSRQDDVAALAGLAIAIPGLVGFLAVRSLAWDDSQWKEKPRCQILTVTWLRRHLRRFLGLFGLSLTLIVVTTAARRQLVLAFYKNSSYPQESVLLYGLVFAGVLALFHISATMAIDGRCQRLLASYAPVPDPEAQDISAPLARRQDLASFLGMDTSWKESFQNGVTIFAPLLTALIGIALPK